ncbi:MAG TPA: copper homeostasis membrane protein CopD [Pseudolabrys sp.]|nr:copper homeostasis membrane protein CopD [Pseudolabrys sp.]
MPDPLVIVRAIHIAATLLASGTVLFWILVAKPAFRAAERHEARERFRRGTDQLTWCALAVAVASGAAWLVLLAASILGTSILDAVLRGGVLSVAEGTLFGFAWTVRLALALSLAGLLLWPAAGWLQAGIACAFAALIAFSGHAAATPGMAGDIHLAADMAHLIAAAAWLGALPPLAWLIALMRRRRESTDRSIALHAIKRFSWIGMICVAVLLATGIMNSLYLLAGPRDLIETGYGRFLLVKIVLFAFMAAVATINRFSVTPRLPTPRAMGALVRNSIIETALGLGVITAVAALGVMEPGSHAGHHLETAIPESAAFVHLHMPDVMADVTVDPGRLGQSHAILRVMREDGTTFPAKDVKFAIDPPGATAAAPPRAAKRMPDGRWRVDAVDLARAGVWTVRVIVRTGVSAPAVLDGPIVIER